MAEHRIGELPGGRQRLIAVTELLAEEMVDGSEDLRAGAIVLGERQTQRRALSPLAEDGDVGMTKAVDRLELVTDEEHIGRTRSGAQQVDDLALEPVRVLELVDHDRAEAQLLRLTNVGMVAQQVTGIELEILEVEGRLARLRSEILGCEQVEELLQQLAVTGGELVERRLVEAVARVAELCRPVTAGGEMGEVEELLRIRAECECSVGGGQLLVGHLGVGGQCLRGSAKLRQPFRDAYVRAELQVELPPRRAQGLVDAGEHPAEPLGAVGREQPQALGVTARAEAGERPLERLTADHRPVLVVELAEARVDPGREGMGPQEPRAEPVDGRDPGAVEPAGEIVSATRMQRRADAGAQLPRRLAGVGDDEHRLDVEPLLADCADEPLDEHRGLARACPGRDEHLARRLHRCSLLGVHLRPAPRCVVELTIYGRSTRHIVQRSHQDGQVPPFGSCRTSPARMRWAYPRARSRAVSTSDQNSSPSR